MINPGGTSDCAKGGKCVFKFAACTKCGRGEGGVAAGGRRPVAASSPPVAPAGSAPVFSSGEVGRAGGGYPARPAPAPPAPAPAGEPERRPSDVGREVLAAVLGGQPLPGGYTGGDAAPKAPMPGGGAATSE